MNDSRTTADQPVKPRKQVLTPPTPKEPSNENSFVTPRGGELEIEFVPQFGLYRIKSKNGIVPERLRGLFTESKIAEYQLERYLQDYWKGRG